MQHFYALGGQAYYFAGTYVAYGFVVEVRECRCLAAGCVGHGFFLFAVVREQVVGFHLLADDDGGAAEEVAGTDDAVLGQYEHGAGAFNLAIDEVDAIDEGLAHINKECYEFCLVDFVG